MFFWRFLVSSCNHVCFFLNHKIVCSQGVLNLVTPQKKIALMYQDLQELVGLGKLPPERLGQNSLPADFKLWIKSLGRIVDLSCPVSFSQSWGWGATSHPISICRECALTEPQLLKGLIRRPALNFALSCLWIIWQWPRNLLLSLYSWFDLKRHSLRWDRESWVCRSEELRWTKKHFVARPDVLMAVAEIHFGPRPAERDHLHSSRWDSSLQSLPGLVAQCRQALARDRFQVFAGLRGARCGLAVKLKPIHEKCLRS